MACPPLFSSLSLAATTGCLKNSSRWIIFRASNFSAQTKSGNISSRIWFLCPSASWRINSTLNNFSQWLGQSVCESPHTHAPALIHTRSTTHCHHQFVTPKICLSIRFFPLFVIKPRREGQLFAPDYNCVCVLLIEDFSTGAPICTSHRESWKSFSRTTHPSRIFRWRAWRNCIKSRKKLHMWMKAIAEGID